MKFTFLKIHVKFTFLKIHVKFTFVKIHVCENSTRPHPVGWRIDSSNSTRLAPASRRVLKFAIAILAQVGTEGLARCQTWLVLSGDRIILLSMTASHYHTICVSRWSPVSPFVFNLSTNQRLFLFFITVVGRACFQILVCVRELGDAARVRLPR